MKMMLQVWCLFALITTGFLNISHAFWWNPTTTKAPETMKQIPLTYFRTYTYQPAAASPLSYPFFGTAAAFAQQPLMQHSTLLNAGPRYDAFTGNYVPANMVVAPPNTLSTTPSTTRRTTTAATTTTTTTPRPTTPPTTTTSSTTTTTTTTTPAPTTTSSTTTAAPITMPPTATGQSSQQYPGEYPTFNRRLYTAAYNQPSFYRPPYPYPEYSTYNGEPLKPMGQAGNIQFVPCMCPVNIGLSAGLGRKNSMDLFLTESRTLSDQDDGMELPLEDDLPLPKVGSGMVNSGVLNADVLNKSLTNSVKVNEGVLNKVVLNKDAVNKDVFKSSVVNSEVINTNVQNSDNGLNVPSLNERLTDQHTLLQLTNKIDLEVLENHDSTQSSNENMSETEV